MLTIAFLAVTLCGCILLSVSAQGLSANGQWQQWKREHKKLFATEEEESRRFGIWKNNLAAIEEHNGQNHSFTLEMNHFGDLVRNACVYTGNNIKIHG